jgi:glycosyltransferase involved in cell wall biosynthesis
MVSVVIPTYKEEKYIGATLRALKQQTYRSIEVIVSDSSSPDDTVRIARKFADKVVVTKQRGISLGRNLGAKAAQGDILLFIDADTALHPDFITNIARAFEDGSVVMAAGVIRSDGPLVGRLIYRACGELAWLLAKINHPRIYGICMAVRRNAFEKLGGFDEKLETAEDMDITGRARKLGKCLVLRNAIAYTSSRRLKMGAGTLYTVGYHVANFFRYRLLGTGAKGYPVIR